MSKPVGIDALGYALPRLVLPMQAFAEGRGMEYEKLRFGLGLEAMAVPDTDEDCVTLAAQAAWQLLEQHGIAPHELGRIYLGTESAVDAAKPSATYVHGLLEARFAAKYGPRSLAHCDALDMTFACAGGVDALLNSADWVRAGRGRKALVIAADVAKYAPHSPGEYTQGAGAVALLVTEDPRILVLDEAVGVSVESASDFFKPRRTYAKAELAAAVGGTVEAGSDHPFWATPDAVIEQFLEFPVFDGPYSNDCYVGRVREALGRYEAESGLRAMNDWFGMCFHLPYAFQGRRMWPEIALDLYADQGLLAQVEDEAGTTEAEAGGRKGLAKVWSKSAAYKAYVAEKIGPGEAASMRVGNMYTASIFMGLISALVGYSQRRDLGGKRLGFLSYGSGSKSKVFSGVLRADFAAALSGLGLEAALTERRELHFAEYEALHARTVAGPRAPAKRGAVLDSVGREGNLLGYRNYRWVD
ncbi:MAG: hydroxymethylglutaryl-CoA synthase family protein [Schleiferiaceae bacterium]